MTQLLVIDTNTLEAKAFDGRILIDKAKLDIDKDTTPEGLIEVLEDFRMVSTVQLRDARRQMELMQIQEADAKRWAPKNAVNVTFKELKRVVQ